MPALTERLSPGGRWLVAFSAGMDSSALLHAACAVAGARQLVAVHVHHGLQQAGEAWPAHCEAVASALGVQFECVRLSDSPGAGQSLEAWARERRYQALAQAAERHRVDAVLTAHHADDQVETMLMRLARGAGLDGLCGIAPEITLHGARVLRPWLDFPRGLLLEYAREHQLNWVEDPSNRDLSRTRNALRHGILPALDAADPSLRERIHQALPGLRKARDAQRALAQQDLRAASAGQHLQRQVLRALPKERCDAALRLWLRQAGLEMPSRARLAQMRRQLVEAAGAHGRVAHQGVLLLRDRDRIRIADPAEILGTPVTDISLRWQGQDALALPDGHGWLAFESHEDDDEAGLVSATWLREQVINISAGGRARERLRTRPGAISRTLKNLYQEREVPAWMRPGLPLVHVGGHLLYAAGLGMDCSSHWPRHGRCVRLRWTRDAPVRGVASPAAVP
ncbi:MAG: tRNA lysidine(34) synthetase TilS [Quisquiliibacterium sp.]